MRCCLPRRAYVRTGTVIACPAGLIRCKDTYMSLRRRSLLTAATAAMLLPALVNTGYAQNAPAMRVRGTIASVAKDSVVVKTRSGDAQTIKTDDKTTYGWIATVPLSSIKKGSYIGTAAVSQSDGTLKALEVHVFPESMRGAGEGFRPWDQGPDSSMTNGTVGDVKVANGRTLHVAYQGGEKVIYVPPNAPIVTFEPATATAVKPGSHVIVFATKSDDGTMTAASIRVGKNGITPPM